MSNFIERYRRETQIVHDKSPKLYTQLCSHLAACIASFTTYYGAQQGVSFRGYPERSDDSGVWRTQFICYPVGNGPKIEGVLTVSRQDANLVSVQISSSDHVVKTIEFHMRLRDGKVPFSDDRRLVSIDEVAEAILGPIMFRCSELKPPGKD